MTRRFLRALLALAVIPVTAAPLAAQSRTDSLLTELTRLRGFIRAAETQATKTRTLAESLRANPTVVYRTDTVRTATPVDTAQILRDVCMYFPYTSQADMDADTVTITTPSGTSSANYWCAFAEIRDSTALVAPATSTASLMALGAEELAATAATVLVLGGLFVRRKQA